MFHFYHINQNCLQLIHRCFCLNRLLEMCLSLYQFFLPMTPWTLRRSFLHCLGQTLHTKFLCRIRLLWLHLSKLGCCIHHYQKVLRLNFHQNLQLNQMYITSFQSFLFCPLIHQMLIIIYLFTHPPDFSVPYPSYQHF